MFRGILFIFAATLLCWQLLPLNSNAAPGGLPEPCSLKVSFIEPGSRCWFICPQGDGHTLAKGNNRIRIVAINNVGQPVPGILASDIWLIGCENLYLCAGSGSIDADSATNEQGITTISGTLAAGGGDLNGVYVVIVGIIAGCPPCKEMLVVSPDLDSDGDVDLGDFSIFGTAFGAVSSDPDYDPYCDFDCDSDVDIGDFSMFAQHWQHHC